MTNTPEDESNISDDAIAVITRVLVEQTSAYPELRRVVADTIQNIHQLRRQRDEAIARMVPQPTSETPLDRMLAELEGKRSSVPIDVNIPQSLVDALSTNDEVVTLAKEKSGEEKRKAGPCGNEDCDACYPIPHWLVSEHRVQHITHAREIKAATPEEALAIYKQGTAWPSSYDDRGGQILQLDPIVVEKIEDDGALPPHWQCWHNL